MRAGKTLLPNIQTSYSKAQLETNVQTKETIHKMLHPDFLVIFTLGRRATICFVLFFCKEPDSKYFRLSNPDSLTTT